MSLMTDAIEYRRLRAPKADGGVLVDPPRTEIAALLERNRSCLAGSPEVQAWAVLGRRELIDAAVAYTQTYRNTAHPGHNRPLILAGHQPQLFHPGVWYKNFLLGDAAATHGATAVNLIIDSDAMRSASIRVPGGTAAHPHVEAVPFDQAGGETPYEEHRVIDTELFESFGTRAAQTIGSMVPDPLVRQFWPQVIERGRAVGNVGLAISQARHIWEGNWGSCSLELPQSRLCGFESFRRFTLYLLSHAVYLRDLYNAAAAAYRRTNRIRSRSHPVPDLAQEGDFIETPYWIWSTDQPRRHRLFVRDTADGLELCDRDKLCRRLSSDADTALSQLAELEEQGVKLRTRALVTTMFARLVLGDLFIHGIGGAKYDQVTDAILQPLFAVEPPGYLTATATLRLPIQRPGVTVDDVRRVEHRLRELQFHPERWLADVNSQAKFLIDEKQAWIATPVTHDNARQRCQAIRMINEALQPHVEHHRASLRCELATLREALRIETLLGSREYAFCLYPAEQLQKLFQTR